MNTCLSIAGSDPSGGAGIQADLKTMTVNGVYAMCAITALTVQNTLGVTNILEVGPEFLGQQIDAVFQDIRPDAVKVGMVSSAGLIRVIAQKLRQYGAQNVVVDPVMVSTSGSRLLESDAAAACGKSCSPGRGGDAQHPRGPGPFRAGHPHPRGHGGRRQSRGGRLRLRRAVQGRPQPQRRQRLPVLPGAGPVVLGPSASATPTPTARAALSPALSRRIWQRGTDWRRR